MTEFKTHKGVGLRITGAHVEPDTSGETPKADRVVLETAELGRVTYKPRTTRMEEKKVDGLPTKQEVEEKYPISQLPSDLKAFIEKVNKESEVTATATVGEAVQDGGESSYFIRKDDWETLDVQQDTLFGDEEAGE